MEENNSFNIREFLNKLLFHWPLFLISLGIAFTVAFVYLKYTKPLYDIQAKLLIKDQKSKASEGAALSQLNLTETGKGVDTERGILTSRPIVEQVVVDLQLWATYEEPTKFYNYQDIYTSTPVLFKLLRPEKTIKPESFDIIIENENFFSLKQSGGKTKRFSFKSTLNNYFGTWKLDTTRYLKNYIGKTIRVSIEDPKEVIKEYQGKIDAVNLSKTNPTIDLTIEDEVPERGRVILNDLLRVYIAAAIEDKRKATENTLKFLDDRLKSITDELNGVEKEYEGYKSSRGIIEISSESAKYLSNSQVTDAKLNEIGIEMRILDDIERYVNSPQGVDNPPAMTGMEDAGLSGLVQQLSTVLLEKSRLLATTPETNPIFLEINKQIVAIRTAIKENIRGVRASLQTQTRQLQNLGSGYESSIRNIPGQERELVGIKRMQGIKENLYIYLLQKKEEISLDYASTIADARTLEQAHYGYAKSPIPKQAYAIALLAGLLLPAGLILGRDAIRSRVMNKKEITSKTGVPLLSELIFEEHADPIVVLNRNSYIGEQFRDLRTKINYLHGKSEKGKTTLFTSSISGEGKSFVSSNLGVTLAVSGRKTIILEFDLRRPQLSTIFKLDKSKPGLSNYLIGEVSKEQVIQKSGLVDNLFVIDCGTIPPNPSELLESDELSILINELKSEYDHILIDSPPVHLVTDAMILAPMCDVTLYLIRQDYTPAHELDFIRQVYKEKKLPRLNAVFNGIEIEKHGYGYNYSNNGYYVKSPKNFKGKLKTFASRF